MREAVARFVLAFAFAGVLALPAAEAATVGDDAAVDLSKPPVTYTVNDAIPGKDGVKRMALLRGLDKLTGQSAEIDAPVGVPVHYATLTITAHYCYSTPPSETPDTTAFLTIVDQRPDKPAKQVFSGWMWASSPSLNGMEHPLYDVWVVSCKTNAPDQDTSREAVGVPAAPTPKAPGQ